jgi:hypothetical protein
MRKALEIPPLTAEEVKAVEKLYRTTKDAAAHTRSHRAPGGRAAHDRSR